MLPSWIVISHSRVTLKRVFVQNLSHENEFDLHEIEPVGETHFHMQNGFAPRFALTQRQKPKGNLEVAYWLLDR